MAKVNVGTMKKKGKNHMQKLDARDSYEKKARSNLVFLNLTSKHFATRNIKNGLSARDPKSLSGGQRNELVPTMLTGSSDNESVRMFDSGDK